MQIPFHGHEEAVLVKMESSAKDRVRSSRVCSPGTSRPAWLSSGVDCELALEELLRRDLAGLFLSASLSGRLALSRSEPCG